MPDTRDSIRRCTTIQERMDVAASSRFRAVVESMYDLTLNPSDPNDSVSMELTLPQVGNVCDTTFSGCDFSQRFAEILEGPDVSNSVQAQSTNDYEETSDYDISSSDDEKPERKEQSFHVYCHSKDEILHHNENLGNHLFQQLQLDCGTDNLLPSSSTGNSVKGIDNMLQSSANCNTEEKETDGDCISYEIIAVPPQTRKRKMTTRRRNAFSVQEALDLGEGSILFGDNKNSKGNIPHSIAFHVAFQDTI